MVYISDCLVKMQKVSYTLQYSKLKMAIYSSINFIKVNLLLHIVHKMSMNNS